MNEDGCFLLKMVKVNHVQATNRPRTPPNHPPERRPYKKGLLTIAFPRNKGFIADLIKGKHFSMNSHYWWLIGSKASWPSFKKKKRKTDEWLAGKFQPIMNEYAYFLLKLRWFSSQSGSCPAYVNIYIYTYIDNMYTGGSQNPVTVCK